MTTEEVIKRVKQLDIKGRVTVGFQIISEVLPFVPIASGDLRRSGRVEQGIDKVEVVFGGKSPGARADVDYAAFQDNEKGKELFHLGARGKYRSLGSTSEKYARNYRQAKDLNLLTPSRAKWFEIVLKDKRVLKKLIKIYAKVLKKGL